MKTLGISGSPRRGNTTDLLVQEVLAAVGGQTEFVSLAGKRIAPCRACLACVQDNVCKIKDDMTPLREKILAADALVIGAPNYFATINALTHCFLERLCQFRHNSSAALARKPVALVGVGGLEPDIPAAVIGRMLPYYRMELVGQVSAQGAAACFTCGLGEHCRNGAIHLLFGPDAKITDEMIPNLANQPEKLACARALGEKLRNRFIQSHPTEPSPNAHRQSQQHP